MTTLRTRNLWIVAGALSFAPPAAGPVPAVEPRAEAVDPAVKQALADLDRKAAGVRDVTAGFKEYKYTPLLRRPLVTEGVLRIRGGTSRWDAQKPRPIVTLIGGDEVRMYYPERATVEVYEIGASLRFMAVSPLPRPATLQEHFRLVPLPLDPIDGPWNERTHLGIRLTPTSSALREYIETVDVVIERESSYVVRAELRDADGDRTVLIFSDIRVNTGLTDGDMQLALAPGTKVVRPLAGKAEAPGVKERAP